MKKLWGGRFKKETHPALKCFSYSLAVDGELLDAELRVNEAWAKMLVRTGLITRKEGVLLLRGLKQVEKILKPEGAHQGIDRKWYSHEDIHTLIQVLLEQKAGPVGKKIHTGRSRNDLVITSTRIYLKDRIQNILDMTRKFQRALITAAKKAGDAVIPGMTHLKKAQPVLMGHHLLAYVEMLEEDCQRLFDVLKRVDVLPLGSGALAGSGLEIDQKFLANQLGFSRITRNSMQATSDRGFMAEILAALAIQWVHFSRLSEDFILWNSEAFRYVELDDAFATGSSLMPQKKNPDVFELLRGRTGVIFGHLQALLTLQKGLPLAYNRDLQEDKPALFDALRKTGMALRILALTVESVTFNAEAMALAANEDVLYATDLLEFLVKKKVPFTEAHETVGKAVRYSQESGKALSELSIQEWKSFSKLFDEKIYQLFDRKTSVTGKRTIGSTNPARVKSEIKRWERELRNA